MNLDAAALENARVIELLVEIRDELRRGRVDIDVDPFLQGILSFIGCQLVFTASELMDAAALDAQLRQVLGDLDAFALGRSLSDRENHVVLGRKLVKVGRSGATGNRWRFEPA